MLTRDYYGEQLINNLRTQGEAVDSAHNEVVGAVTCLNEAITKYNAILEELSDWRDSAIEALRERIAELEAIELGELDEVDEPDEFDLCHADQLEAVA